MSAKTLQEFEAWLREDKVQNHILDIYYNVLNLQEDITEYLRTGPVPLTEDEEYMLLISLPPEYLEYKDRYIGIYQTFIADITYRFQRLETQLVERDDPRCPKCNYFPLACKWSNTDGIVYTCAKCEYVDTVELDMFLAQEKEEEAERNN